MLILFDCFTRTHAYVMDEALSLRLLLLPRCWHLRFAVFWWHPSIARRQESTSLTAGMPCCLALGDRDGPAVWINMFYSLTSIIAVCRLELLPLFVLCYCCRFLLVYWLNQYDWMIAFSYWASTLSLGIFILVELYPPSFTITNHWLWHTMTIIDRWIKWVMQHNILDGWLTVNYSGCNETY